MVKLYSYWRSSTAYRVRVALNVKKVEYEIIPVHLTKEGGEQHKEEYRRLNPQGFVPALVDGDITISQSISILEYLEEKIPSPPLLPAGLGDKAFARQIAQIIASDIHPVNNLRILNYLKDTLGIDEEKKKSWYQHWILEGFKAIESLLNGQRTVGPYCLGEQLTIADLCLVPQMYNAHRFNMSLDDFPVLCRIEANCLALDVFKQAKPENQIDAEI